MIPRSPRNSRPSGSQPPWATDEAQGNMTRDEPDQASESYASPSNGHPGVPRRESLGGRKVADPFSSVTRPLTSSGSATSLTKRQPRRPSQPAEPASKAASRSSSGTSLHADSVHDLQQALLANTGDHSDWLGKTPSAAQPNIFSPGNARPRAQTLPADVQPVFEPSPGRANPNPNPNLRPRTQSVAHPQGAPVDPMMQRLAQLSSSGMPRHAVSSNFAPVPDPQMHLMHLQHAGSTRAPPPMLPRASRPSDRLRQMPGNHGFPMGMGPPPVAEAPVAPPPPQVPLSVANAELEYVIDIFQKHFNAPLEARDASGRTPLIIAAMDGRDMTVRTLIRIGASVDATDTQGNAPLHYAALEGHVAVAESLLGAKSSPDCANSAGTTPLMFAAMTGKEALVAFLCKSGAGLNTTDHEGRTPLTLAVLHNQQGVVRLLIAAGADTTIADRHGMTATDYAHELRLQVCVALLTVARSFPSQSAASPQMPTRHAPRDYESVPAFSRSASATSLHSSSSAVSEQSSRAGTPTDGSDLSLHLPADAPKLTPSPAPNDESSEEDWDKEVELEQLLHDAQDEVDPDWEDIDDEEIHLHPNAEIQPEVPALLKASASYGMVTITPNRSRPSDEPDEPEPDPITPRHVAHRTAGGVVVALDSDTDLPADKIKDKKPRTTKGTKLEIPLGNAAPASSGDEVDEEAAAAMQAEQQAAEDRRKELIEEKRLKMHKRFLEKKKRKAEEMRARKQKIAEERERRKQEKLERQREHEEALAQLAAQEEEAQKKKKKGKKKKKPNLTKHMSMRNLKSRRTLGGRLTGLAAAIEEDKRSRSSSTGRRKRTPLRRSASSSSVESDLHTQAGKDDEDDEEEADTVEEEEEASEESDSESDSEDDGAAENDSKPKPRKRRVKKKKQQGASIFDRLARGTASSQARRGEALRRRSGGKAKQAPISKEEQRRNRRATMGGRMQSSSKGPKTKTVKKRKNAGKRKKSRNDSEEFGPVKLTRASRSPVPAEAEEEAAEEAEAVEEEQPETVEEEEEQEEEAAQGRGRSRVRNGGSRTRSRSRPRVPIQETKRSNYKLVCSALRYRCLRGYAHDHVRGGVLDMLKPFRKGNFVIVVEGHANSFRGVMRLDLQTGQALHIYGHVPDVIEARNVKTFFKYASDTKYFIPIQVTTFSPTTDAVALRPVPLKEQTDHRTSIMEGDWEAELLRLEQERLLVEVIHTNAGGPNGRGKKKGARASASPSNANRALKKPRRVLKPSDLQLSEAMSQELAVYTCYLNMCLEDDPHLQGVLPLDVKTPELLVAMRDGWILAKFVNYAVPLTIDTRALTPSEGEPLRKRAMLENMTLVVDACRSIGVKMANVSARMLVRPKKNEKQCIGFLWRLIKSQLLDKINVRHSPALLRLLGEHEDAEEFAKQSPRVLLLRWLEYHTHAACSSEDVAAILAKTVGITDVHVDAFSHEHLRDMLCYALLMNQLAPDLCHNEWLTNVLLDIKRGALDSVGRALRQSLIGLGLSTALAFLDVTAMSANSRMSNRLHLSFSALIFQAFPGLVPLTSAEIAEEKAVLMDDDKGDSREERAFRMWMNSMNLARRDGKRRYLDNLFEDCRDGLALLEVIDKLAPGSVNWSTVKVEPRNKFERVGNCNQAIELAKSKLGCSLQGIQGSDLEGANRKLCLALVWQLMSHHLAQFLREVFERKFGHPPKGGSNDQKMILEWANQRAKQGPDGMDEPVDVRPLTSFKDPELRDALFFLHLLWAISPRVVDWDLVTKGSTPAERLLNARYAISVARKLGAAIFLLPEDITECRPRLVQTFVASILSLETLTCGTTVEEDEDEEDDE